jgi:hypothetical protein
MGELMGKDIVAVLTKEDLRKMISLKEREISLNNLLLQLIESGNSHVLLEKVRHDNEKMHERFMVTLYGMLEKYEVNATGNVYLDFSTGMFKITIED